MSVQKPLSILFFLTLLNFAGFSQPVDHSIDSIIHLITPYTYRIHFDSLRTSEGCNRKVYETIQQGKDHDACRNYIYRTFTKYLGVKNVYQHDFKSGDNGGLTNIVAFKEGKSRSKGILILSAHYDSNNSREQGNSEQLCSPGANDNGTGLAAILEIARVLSGVETDISILFAAWDFEEQFPYGYPGGSNIWFADHVIHKKNMNWGNVKDGGKIRIDKLFANINFDMFGHPNDTIDGKPALWACSGNVIHSGFIKEYISTFNRYIPEIAVVNQGKLIFSDHYTFAAREIPSVENLESGYDKDPFYHTCSDKIENVENINFDFAVNVTRGGLAFTLEKAGIYFPSVRKVITDLSPVIICELPGVYSLKSKGEDCNVIIIDQFGNKANTFKRGDFFIFSANLSGLYEIYIFSSEGRASRKIFLQKKEGQLEPFL
jgi:hypothetical protein